MKDHEFTNFKSTIREFAVFCKFFLSEFLLDDFHKTLFVFVLAVPIVVIGFDDLVDEILGFRKRIERNELRQHTVVILAAVVEQVLHKRDAVVEPNRDAFRNAVVQVFLVD